MAAVRTGAAVPMREGNPTRPAVVLVWLAVLVTGCATSAMVGSASPGPSGLMPSMTPSESSPQVADGEEWIVFGNVASEPNGTRNSSQFLVRPDGTDEHRLVNKVVGSEVRATWSPDGKRLAYVQAIPDGAVRGNEGLWIIDADGSHPQHLLRCELPCNAIDHVDWGPDGDSIYFSMDSNVPDAESPPLTFEIWRYDLTTGKAEPVLTREGDDMTVEQPRVSPDGKLVVYMRQRFTEPEVRSAIFVADLEGGPERRLTDWNLYASRPDWSVADVIAFNSYDIRLYSPEQFPGARDLFTIAPDGTGLRRLTENQPGGVRSGQARWTPDGTGITYTQWVDEVSYLAYIDGDGAGQRMLTATPTDGGEPELRPVP